MRCVLLRLTLVLVAGNFAGLADQIFRSGTSMVVLDVSVLDKGRPVDDLTIDDFLVKDNGHPATLTRLVRGESPLDVSVLVDVSDSTGESAPQSIGPLARALESTRRPADRLEIRPFGIVTPQGVPSVSAPVDWPLANGHGTAIFDSVAKAVLAPRSPGHRRLVVAVTDGFDNASLLDATLRRDVLASAGVVVSCIRILNSAAYGRFVGFGRGSGAAAAAFEGRQFRELAEQTGGVWIDLFTERYSGPPDAERLHETVRRAIEDFRLRYVLEFSPSSSGAGLHSLSVEILNKKYEIAHRRFYWY